MIRLAVTGAVFACAVAAWAQDAVPVRHFTQLEDKELFLRTGTIVGHKPAPGGVTDSQRCTIELDGFRHDGHIQIVDISEREFESPRGKELNFRDTYKFNIAAYELAKLLGIADMVPPSVFRKAGGSSAAVTWWVDDVLMLETQRLKKKISPPDQDHWNREMYVVRVFDQLIYNTDRNLGNLIIDKNWQLWMIDHTRAFRMLPDLPEAKNLGKCDRALLARLRALDRETLNEKLGRWLTGMEISGILKRRDKIVKIFDDKIRTKGEMAVLYDRPARQ